MKKLVHLLDFLLDVLVPSMVNMMEQQKVNMRVQRMELKKEPSWVVLLELV